MTIELKELTNMLRTVPDEQRAQLVPNLLASLPSRLTNQDGGVAEALQQPISLEDLDAAIRNRRRYEDLAGLKSKRTPSLGTSRR